MQSARQAAAFYPILSYHIILYARLNHYRHHVTKNISFNNHRSPTAPSATKQKKIKKNKRKKPNTLEI